MAPCFDSSIAEDSTWLAAAPVCCAASLTLPMVLETSCVPWAACCTLREISSVAALCCSTAAAMAFYERVR